MKKWLEEEAILSTNSDQQELAEQITCIDFTEGPEK